VTANLVQSIKETDLKEGCMKPVRLKGRAILLIRKGGAVFGVSNCCPHMGCSLERGILRDYLVMCPSHGWKFDIRNGKYTENEEISLISYPCKIQNGRVYVELEP
jgi:3-phenylpropionate/trans-cinnamate dioxygenase ferredoxin subunit